MPFDVTRKEFLIVRNPTRDEDSRKLLVFLVYIISGELGKLWRISQAHHYLKPQGIEKENDMIINFFGGLEIHTMHGSIDSGSLEKTRCDDYWLKAEETEYHKRYIDTLDRLCELLYTKNDYSTIRKYCLKALWTDAYDHRIYHWMILSMYMTGDWKSCGHFYRMARKKLGEEYFEKLHEVSTS